MTQFQVDHIVLKKIEQYIETNGDDNVYYVKTRYKCGPYKYTQVKVKSPYYRFIIGSATWVLTINGGDESLTYSPADIDNFNRFIEESYEMETGYKSRYLMSLLQRLIVSGSMTKAAI